MGVSLHLFFICLVLFLKQVLSCPDDQCRILAFPSTLFFVGERLFNHTMANISVIDRDTCEYRCYLDHNCVSINFYFGQNEAETHNCELNNSTSREHEKDLVKAANFVYHGTKNFCARAPCENNATCQSGFTRKRYRCLCASGFTGQDCENDIDECAENNHNCTHGNSTCTNTEGSFICIDKPGFSEDERDCTDIDECAENTHNCSLENFICENEKGSFGCICKPGFSGNENNCTVEVKQSTCSSTTNKIEQGTINTPKHPKNYGKHTSCSWVITSSLRINLVFRYFHLEKYYDFLYVYDGKSASSRRIGKFSGRHTNKVIKSSGNHLYLEFTSDYSINKKGFLIAYKAMI
ncbi:dorsal-ventral patterning tolloid-like protein 1 isoform X2 [Stylophora pistillata]|uniref:dorsal-ventral patterning tolloid-like protein 1 isoform X2 n=1 Tax=Stylophora pistillata TaxID=50429 RepID=UPI000C0432F7|nr:dorsal-ventral patterning tolloid-like protein 1 isoform X2 [Stylophora pistillata]